MATREDMVALANKVRAALEGIKRYRDELLLVADACSDSIDLPSGLFSEPELPDESMIVLLSSLSWVRKLALAWESPNATALMKSKGLLFLLAYAWVCTAARLVDVDRKPQHRSSKGTTSYRLSTGAAQELAEVAHIYLGRSFTAGDLNDKLQDFATSEPEVFRGLLALAETLHETARNTSSAGS
jgi:hypothetical protein